MKTPIRVAVTGAAGQIGYSLLFRIASGAMFGPDQPIILQLIEAPIEKALKALEGVAMDVDGCAFSVRNRAALFTEPAHALMAGKRWPPVLKERGCSGGHCCDPLDEHGPVLIAARGVIPAAPAANALVDHVRDLVTP